MNCTGAHAPARLYITVPSYSIVHKWKSDFNISADFLRDFFLISTLRSTRIFCQGVLDKILFSRGESHSNMRYRTRDYVKLALTLMTYALSAKPREKLCIINCVNGLTPAVLE